MREVIKEKGGKGGKKEKLLLEEEEIGRLKGRDDEAKERE